MPTNVFPNHSVAPLCAGKIYSLYIECQGVMRIR